MKDEMKNETTETKIISIDEGRVREHLDGVVREAVEETLNKLLSSHSQKNESLCCAGV